MSPSFRVEAVKRYRAPRYPRFGYVIPPRPERILRSRLPLRKLAVAAVGGATAFAAPGCFFPGGISSQYCQEVVLTEDEARAALRESFTARGYTITEDFDFVQDPVSFTADGYDPVATVGYEYRSQEDGLDLSSTEEQQLMAWAEADGPFFRIFTRTSSCIPTNGPDDVVDDTEMREDLRLQLGDSVTSFLDQLEASGHL